MIKELNNVNDIFQLQKFDIVTKRNLFDLIKYSKVEGSKYWSDAQNIINNTPMQGINSIGKYPNIKGVIIKTKKGVYENDGWDQNKREYKYAFKAANGIINLRDEANKSLLEQPKYNYPIFLFIENKNNRIFEGSFKVIRVFEDHVILTEMDKVVEQVNEIVISTEDEYFEEGEKKLAIHYKTERNRKVIDIIKSTRENKCDICNLNFKTIYGFQYIEAHHKIPHSSIKGIRSVKISDFALLCPNCHRAVHLYMSKYNYTYDEILKYISPLVNN